MNKKLMYGIPLGVFAISMVFAAVMFAQTNVQVQVSESLFADKSSISFSGVQVGDTNCDVVTLSNHANVSIPVTLTWNEISNADAVTYTTNLPQDVTVDALGSLPVNICATTSTGSNVGSFEGNVTYTRN